MKIKEILRKKRTLSFEFFPPKERDRLPSVYATINNLKAFRPNFISVTYGAGGTTRELTEEIVLHAKNETDLEVMAHLTCAAQTKEAVHGVLTRLEQAGIENVIALRGDPPRGQTSFVPAERGFAHATDLIDHIKRNFKFGLAAACYPETHSESWDLCTDLKYTKLKVDLGAHFLITQLFYDNNDFFTFLDRARQWGIEVPILPGLLPILTTRQIRRFAKLCGASIPRDLDRQLEEYADDDTAVRELGIEHTSEQVRQLWDYGVQGIHFYVLNRSYSVSKILRNVGLQDHIEETSE